MLKLIVEALNLLSGMIIINIIKRSNGDYLLRYSEGEHPIRVLKDFEK